MSIQQADPNPVVQIPPNQSLLLLDSRFRALNESPYDFTSTLSAGLVAKQISYKRLFWSSPFFTHNVNNCEILIRFMNDDRNVDPTVNPYTYVAYMQPWVQIISFDGNDAPSALGPSFMDDPKVGSYAHYLQTSLNDLRKYESNLAHYPVTVNGGHTITAYVRYNPARGFVIYFEDDDTKEQVLFDIMDCDWIKNAHFVHGYGVYDQKTFSYRPLFYDVPNASYKNAYYSDATPQLLYTRYIIVISKELTRDRRVQSFSSALAADDFPSEIAVIPTTYKNIGVYHQENIGEDATVIPMRDGNQPQFVRITIEDENGNILVSGDPVGNFLADQNVPAQLVFDFFNPDIGFQSSNLLNYLIFQRVFEPSPDSRTNPEVLDMSIFKYIAGANYTIPLTPNDLKGTNTVFIPYVTWTTTGLKGGNETVDGSFVTWNDDALHSEMSPFVAYYSLKSNPPFGKPYTPPDPSYQSINDQYLRFFVLNNVQQVMVLTFTNAFALGEDHLGNVTMTVRAIPYLIDHNHPEWHPYPYANEIDDYKLFEYKDVLVGSGPFMENPMPQEIQWHTDFIPPEKIPLRSFFLTVQYEYDGYYPTDFNHQALVLSDIKVTFQRKNPPPPDDTQPVPPPVPDDPPGVSDPPYTVNDVYIPIPKENYPYARYNTVLLDDDVIHDIAVVSSF